MFRTAAKLPREKDFCGEEEVHLSLETAALWQRKAAAVKRKILLLGILVSFSFETVIPEARE